jgi:hypothetical protein
MTRNGFAYELPMSEPRTDENGSSSSPLLPTPSAEESTPTDDYVAEMQESGIDPAARLYLPGRKWHAQRTLSRIVPALLPTPTAGDHKSTRNSTGDERGWERGARHAGTTLTDAASKLLPTPSASQNDGHDPEVFLERREREKAKGQNGNGFGMTLGMAVQLLPTPTGDDANNVTRESGDFQSLAREAYKLAEPLLPTPTTQDAKNTAGPSQHERNSDPLNVVAAKMLPTPTATYPGGSEEEFLKRKGREPGGAIHLNHAVEKLLPTPVANEENPGAGGELRAAITHGEGRRNETGTDSLGRPNTGRPSRLLPTPETVNRKSRKAMTASTENGRRSGGGNSSPPALEQIVELQAGRWPKDLPPYEELPPATREIVDSLLPARLLPTPVAGDGEGGRTSKGAARPDEAGLAGTMRKLLPTPVVTDSFGSRRSTARTEDWISNEGTSLTDAIWEIQGRETDTTGKLLPTPAAADGSGGRVNRNPETLRTRRRPSGSKVSITIATAIDDLPRGDLMSQPSEPGSESSDAQLQIPLTSEDG